MVGLGVDLRLYVVLECNGSISAVRLIGDEPFGSGMTCDFFLQSFFGSRRPIGPYRICIGIRSSLGETDGGQIRDTSRRLVCIESGPVVLKPTRSQGGDVEIADVLVYAKATERSRVVAYDREEQTHFIA